MGLIRCPKCDAICDSSDAFCRACGHKLKNIDNKEEEAVFSTDESNKVENTETEITNTVEPEWVTNLRTKYKTDKRNAGICTIILIVISLVFLLIMLFDRNKYVHNGVEIVGSINSGWLTATIIFGIVSFISLIVTLVSNMQVALVAVVDGYYVVSYGCGYRWTLYIEGQDVDSTSHLGKYWRIEDIALNGTLPNKQKIVVTFSKPLGTIMHVSKRVDE